MVLRGSEIKPDASLPDVMQRHSDSKREFNKVDQELEATKNAIVSNVLNAHVVVEEMDGANVIKRRLTLDEKKLGDMLSRVEKVKELESKKELAWKDLDITTALYSKTFRQLLCGGAAGAIARSTVAPVDRVKILMQTAHCQKKSHLYGTMGQTVRCIIREEGLIGLWRGNLTNCVRVVPHSAVQFVSYDKIKVWMIGDSDGKLSVPQRLLAGSLSGVAAATVTQPLDVVRIRLQTDPEVKGKVANAFRAMWQERGLISFYKGYTPAMLSLAPFIAVNFAAFDSLKTWWYGSGKHTKDELKARNPLVVLSLGALSGIIAQTICYPLDTVRRRMQMKGKIYPNTPMAFVTIAREEGFAGFYRGMVPNALKVMPNNAIRFAMYETLKNWFVEE